METSSQSLGCEQWPLWLDAGRQMKPEILALVLKTPQLSQPRVPPNLANTIGNPQKDHYLNIPVSDVPKVTARKLHIFKSTRSLFLSLLISQVKKQLQVLLRGIALELIRTNTGSSHQA